LRSPIGAKHVRKSPLAGADRAAPMHTPSVANTRFWTALGVPVDSVAAPAGGPLFGTELAPDAMRDHGLVRRLKAADAGDLSVRIVGPDRDPVSGIVGWPSVGATVGAIRTTVADMMAVGQRPLLLGGCCTILMGAAAGARDALGRVGLAYADGHVDVYDHVTSPTGEAADMPVAGLLGIGWPDLLTTMGTMPVIAGTDIVVLGARDEEEAADVGDLPERLGLTVYGPVDIAADPGALGRATRDRFATADIPYWLHLDLDVLDEAAFPATDYLMPGGIDMTQLADLLRPLGQEEALVGVSIGCYNPQKDPDGACGAALTEMLVDVLAVT
jgi:arginase